MHECAKGRTISTLDFSLGREKEGRKEEGGREGKGRLSICERVIFTMVGKIRLDGKGGKLVLYSVSRK